MLATWEIHLKCLVQPEHGAKEWVDLDGTVVCRQIFWANAKDGAVYPPPVVGEFKDGRGEFYDQEPVNGRGTSRVRSGPRLPRNRRTSSNRSRPTAEKPGNYGGSPIRRKTNRRQSTPVSRVISAMESLSRRRSLPATRWRPARRRRTKDLSRRSSRSPRRPCPEGRPGSGRRESSRRCR
jgi:hypothetical protein